MRILLTLLLLLLPIQAYSADVTASASRSSGVAPLSVHFNADLDESDGVAETFHDYKYVWDFDDSASGTWGTDGLSKDVAYGAVAVHVFEDAGTYNVSLTVYDSSDGSVVSALAESFEIVVAGEDASYPTTATTCISTSGTFTDCPSGANEVTVASGDLGAAIHDYLEAGTRLLLRRGESWTVSSTPSWNNGSGPTTLGAYGTCTGADDLGICSNAPTIAVEIVGFGVNFMDIAYKQNWRFQDITFTNSLGYTVNVQSTRLFGGSIKCQRFTLSRIKLTGFGDAIRVGHYRYNDSDYNDQFVVYSSDIGNAIYFVGERVSIIGSKVHTPAYSHVIRLKINYLNVIQHNELHDAVAGKHVLKLHSPNWEDIGTYADLLDSDGVDAARNGLRTWSHFSIVSDNLINNSGVYAVVIAPENPESDQRITDVIVERNQFISGWGLRDGIALQALRVAGDYVTARNNVFDVTDSDGSMRAITYTRYGSEPSHSGFRVYNNTIYSKDSGADTRVAINIAQGSDVIVRNNYVSFSGSTGTKTLISGSSTNSDNVMTDSAGLVDPDNATVLSRDFQLTAASTSAIDAGYDTPLMDDFDTDARTLTEYDLGAYEYGAVADTTPPTYNSISPTNILPYDTTETLVSFGTSETANCRWDTTAASGATDALKYADLDNAFAQNPGDSFELSATGLTNGMTTRTYYIRCVDTATSPNYTTTDLEIDIDVEAAAQTTPLSPWDSFPEDYAFENPAGTGDAAILSFLVDTDVDRVGTCKWDLSATSTSASQTEAATDYDAMDNAFPQVDQHNARTEITVVDGTTVTYYARCKDNSLTPIYMLSDYTIEVITLEATACELASADCVSESTCVAAWPTYSYCSDFTPACRAAPCIAVSSGSFVSGGGTVVSGGGTWWTD